MDCGIQTLKSRMFCPLFAKDAELSLIPADPNPPPPPPMTDVAVCTGPVKKELKNPPLLLLAPLLPTSPAGPPPAPLTVLELVVVNAELFVPKKVAFAASWLV